VLAVALSAVAVAAIILIVGFPGSLGLASTATTRPTPAHNVGTTVTTVRTNSPSSTVPVTTSTTEPADFFSMPAVAAFLASRAGNVTAAIYNANSGVTYAYHPSLTDDTASIVKADILATLLSESQRSGTPLDDDEQDDATQMIEASNNDAATELWNAAGGAQPIASFDAQLGMTDTDPDNQAWGLTTTTALDQVTLVRHIAYANSFLTDSSRQYELGLMENIDAGENWGVSYGVPGGVTVALKNGWLPQNNGWQINSIGFVDGEGRDYVMAVLTSSDPSESYGINTIQGLSAFVFPDLQPRAKS
jgi:hypothetical protein